MFTLTNVCTNVLNMFAEAVNDMDCVSNEHYIGRKGFYRIQKGQHFGRSGMCIIFRSVVEFSL